MPTDTTDWVKMDKAIDAAREDVRAALKRWSTLLGAAEVLGVTGSERDRHVRASHAQVESARRVLWMED